MKMKLYYCCMLLIAIFATDAYSQTRSFMTYREMQDFQQASPGAFRTGLYGFDNPALLNYNTSESEMMLIVSAPDNNHMDFNRWGLFRQSGSLGTALITQKLNGNTITDWRYSLGFGDKNFSLGISYGFVSGDKSAFKRSNSLGWGFLFRPNEYFSLSGYQNYALAEKEAESVIDVAIRPMPEYLVTFFGDYSMFHDQNLKAGTWSAGVNWEILDGIRISGRYRDDKSVAIGVDLSMRYFGIGATTGFNESGDNSYKAYSVKLGGPDRSIFEGWFEKPHWVSLTMDGDIKYQRFKWFDNSTTLSEIIINLSNATNDEKVEGIMIDARQLSGGISTLWEIRDELRKFRAAGKKVVIFLERSGMTEYYFASVADKIVLDPMGSVQISGFALGRSYYKKMLDNIGIGFEEIRQFKYKSAAESFARDEMSEGDREQRQRLIDDWYNTIKTDVAAARGFSGETFDKLVDAKISYHAPDAKASNLVDTLARWGDRNDIVKALFGTKNISFLNKVEPLISARNEKEPIDDKWGSDETAFALIYVNGDCAMDGGINARELVKSVESAAKDNNIKAIILRVDSPGGDAMASDYIGEVVRKYKSQKPIIVSQGALAASGGYWLSMDATKIVSTPMTITGSIGVISSWIYDKGLKDSLGINTSIVKKGKYSDVGIAYQMPIIPIGLPLRNLNADERQQFEASIADLYKDFVTKVSEGRKMTYDEVHAVAQGRVWTGKDAMEKKLVDELGGLSKAIEIARSEAGISKDQFVNLYEMPERPLFNWGSLFGGMFGIDTEINLKDSDIHRILFRLQNNGTAMPVIPLDYYQFAK